jgi:hypothetical protein
MTTTRLNLTPKERQHILRRLKHGPALSREELAEYAKRMAVGVIRQREKVSH